MNASNKFQTTVEMFSSLTNQEQGQAIAHALNWCGDDIFAVMYEALTEANFHDEAKAMQSIWRAIQENEVTHD